MQRAVILAAGNGTRLGQGAPKALARVAGRPLLAWITAALADVGVRHVHVIVSSPESELARAVGELSLTLKIELAPCPDWYLGNGRSAAFAESLFTDERFFLLMSDHLVSSEHLRQVESGPSHVCVLGTSPPAPWIDVADATKVALDPEGMITDIGKELRNFDAIDTGVFAMTRAVFPALEEARKVGEYSLSAGNRRLCRQRMLRSVSVGDLRWYDVDTPADLAAADAWLSTVAQR